MADALCVSDNAQDALVIVDVSQMKLLQTILVGSKPYPVDLISSGLVLVSTRGEMSVRPVRVSDGCVLDPVKLQHKPRSTTSHPTKNLALIGESDRALTTVVNTETLETGPVVGTGYHMTPKDQQDSRWDFGGDLTCGHPAWGPDDTILHLDRIARRIELYDLQGELITSVNLSSSAHHITPMTPDGPYLALCEGNPGSRINPSVLKFQIKDSSIHVDAHSYLPIPPIHETETGGHHLTYDSKRGRVYVGTNEGRMFTLCGTNLRLLNVADTGPGCGHVTICEELAVATNHTDVSMTVIDLNSGRITGSIDVSKPAQPTKRTQGHTSKWFKDSGRLVTTAAQDGLVLEIDPGSRKITRCLEVDGAYLIQGCFVEI